MHEPHQPNNATRIAGLSRDKQRLLQERISERSRTGEELVSEQLAALGITHIFTITGLPIDKTLALCAARKIRIVGVRDQRSGALMALAQNYAAGKLVAAVMVSPGPAVSNLTTAVLAAHANCWPLLVIGGCAAADLEGLGEFQQLDGAKLFESITKYSAKVTRGAEIPQLFVQAYRTAIAGRPGPVYLDLPANVLKDVTSATVERAPPVNDAITQRAKDAIAGAVELLNGAAKPLMIIGKGVRWSEPYAALYALADRHGIPFVTSPMGRGYLPDSHPLCFNALRSQAISEADLVLVIGARLDWTFRFGSELAPRAKLIHIDIEPSEIGRNITADAGIVADLGHALPLLVEHLDDCRFDHSNSISAPWIADLKSRRRRRQDALAALAAPSTVPLSPQYLINELGKVLPDDAVCILDGATIMAAGQQLLAAHLPVTRYTPGTNGSLGIGIPAAIGAKLHAPARCVVAVCGDLAVGFSIMEFETAVRYGLPIVVIVANNQGPFGRNKQRKFYPSDHPDEVAAYQPGVRYDVICEALGGHGELVDGPDQFSAAWGRCVASGKPGCINVLIDPYAPYPGRD
jgi:2-hydroxyacyl-CoA lyase 1